MDKKRKLDTRDLIVLVQGKPMDLEEELGRRVYFDQYGELCNKFEIKNVPSVVEQEGKEIITKEIKI